MPGCPTENGNEVEEEDGSRSSCAASPRHSETTENNHRDSETGWRSLTGVRAKSANAVLFTSPFCAPVKDRVTLQTETEAQSKETETQTEGRQRLGRETEADGGLETKNLTKTTEVKAKQAAEGRNPDKDPHCVSVNTDTVPYLSIGTNQSKPHNKQSTDEPHQRSQTGKVIERISTWPPTAIQWQARCKMIEKEEEERSDCSTVWTPKVPGEVKKVEHPFGGDEIEKNPMDGDLKITQVNVGHPQSSNPADETTMISEAHTHTDRKQEERQVIQDPATVRQTSSEELNLNQERPGQTQARKPAEKSKSSSRTEPKRAAMSRQRAGNRSTGSKAPSGGASPDDATLLSGNEYAFMDLLHEVVQNNGRWTRERWRQTHVNKQRR
ncbi:uncharacterized protein LOC121607204 [Chelmon rostratus]|uniref:uncharacterized protein LOC121607204 n=1 Tax=Chelmon rostratus TaxID=109905 RepID=UPI001BE5DDCE|nr:uncharacterized protein LOC121607204 [Chelmon rostratus]